MNRNDIEELVFGSIDLDSRTQASRVAVVLYTGGALAAVSAGPLFPDSANKDALSIAAVIAFFVGWAQLALPWDRWHPRTLLLLVLVADVIIGAGGFFVGGVDDNTYYLLPLYSMIFLFVGLTQPPSSTLLNAIPAGISAMFFLGGPGEPDALRAVAIGIPMWIVVGVVLAQVSLFRRRAERSIERLLEAARRLLAARDETQGADMLAEMARDMLEADSVAVMLADGLESSRFTNAGQRDWPTGIGEVVVDTQVEPGGVTDAVRRGETVFVADLLASVAIAPVVRESANARSAAFIPLPGEGGFLGVVVALWTTRRGRLDPFAGRAAELLSSQAGRALERIRATARLAVEAQTDALTALANRRQYRAALEAIVPGDALVMIDLDHFKLVNDRHGHTAGDEVLQALGECMNQVSRAGDCMARYGGEEFAMVLAAAGEQGALQMVNRLRSLWESTNRLTTFSAGISVHRERDTVDVTLEHADAALYVAKNEGRNCTRVHQADAPTAPTGQDGQDSQGDIAVIELTEADDR